jgi:hypothetical protein
MRHKLTFLASILLLTLGVALSGCLRDECASTRTFIRFDPVYKTGAEARTGISAQGPREMRKPGKLYVLGNYLFINEIREGIHVIDNADPKNPKKVAFWAIGGNVDMAIRGNTLYADQYMDLLTIDISDFKNPQLKCRSENVFRMLGFNEFRGFIVDYEETEITEEVACEDNNWGQNWFRREDAIFFDASFANTQSGTPTRNGGTSTPLATAGVAGSYARFALVDQYLYTIDNTMLRSWSLSNPSCPSRLDSANVGWNIETIFPWKDRLFIGSQTGVFIYNNRNPQRPVLEASFSHATGCDPVVVDGDYAYITIHDGTTCRGNINQLDVVGIRNLPQTTLDKVYQMKRPMGLSVTSENLFVCDDGLKIYDKRNPLALKELAHLKSIETYDVIALDERHLLVIGKGGFYQFDVSNPAKPVQISHLAVVK